MTPVDVLRRILSAADPKTEGGYHLVRAERVWEEIQADPAASRAIVAALLTPEDEPGQCPDRCGGVVGHSGYHQSSDHEAIFREARQAATAEIRARLEGLDSAPITLPRAHRGDHDYGLGNPTFLYRHQVLEAVG